MPNLATFQRRIGGRIALVAEANIYGRKVVTYNLHLESRGADELRVRQLNEVLADCRRYVDRPSFVVAGDFNLNAGAGDAARALGDAGFRDAVGSPERPTTPAHVLSHARAIDWIFVSDTADSRGQVHHEIRASDHYPISATLVQPCAACVIAARTRHSPRLFQVGGYLCHRRTANASRIAEALSCASCDPPDISIGRLASVCGAVVGHALACRQRWTVVKPPE